MDKPAKKDKERKKEMKEKKEGNIFLKKRSGLRIIVIKKVGLLSAGDITVAVRGSKGDVTLRTGAVAGCTCGPLLVSPRVVMNLTHQDLLILV